MRKSNRLVLPETIEWVDPASLRLPADQVHTENPVHIEQIAGSIDELNFLDPPLVASDSEVIDGAGRVKAALRRGVSLIPILRIADATPAQVKAVRLALNKIQKNGRLNEAVLKNNIADLLGQGFDVLKLGFDTAEIDNLLTSPPEAVDDVQQETAEPSTVVTRLGDFFTLDSHAIACGDCRDTSLLAQLMGGEQAAACVMDPPFNIAIDGHVSGLGKHKHSEFAMASGEMQPEEFKIWLTGVIEHANRVLRPGGYQYVFMDWRSIHLLVQAAIANGLNHANICVWAKTNSGMGGGLYRSQHEMIGVFKKPGAKSTNNVQLGKFGRNRSNVWDARGANSFGRTRDQDLSDHPTVKPVGLIEDALKDCTKRGEIVLDLFGGSGTAMLAAERCGRKARLVEIEPKYVDITLRRMRDVFDIEAIHVATGLPFSELREQRLAEGPASDAPRAEG